ncbi:hypothetical protein ACHBDQ_005381, partial [Klebsiella pneumoniae]
LICRHIRLFMLKYIAWRNLLSISILSRLTRGAARRGRRPTDPDRRASQPHRAAQRNEPLNNLNENKIILTSDCW